MSYHVHLEPHHLEAMREHDSEPTPGLPGRLPADERVLWQGTPDWRSLAIRAFHARKVAIYCLLLIAWHLVGRLYDGYTLQAALGALLLPALLTIAVVALLAGLAWLSARSTLYTMTNKRIVIRAGIAIPMSVNIPFKTLASGDLVLHRDGTGDIVLKLAGQDRIAYLHLWPHVRRWRFKRPEPMLRCIPEPLAAAELLGRTITPATPPELVAPQAADHDGALSGERLMGGESGQRAGFAAAAR